MNKAYIKRIKEIEQELFDLESDRNNVGNDSVIRFIENRSCKLEKEKLELYSKIKWDLEGR